MLKCDSDKCVNTPEKEMRPDINEARSCDHALASVQFCILSLKIIISVKNDPENLSRRVQFLNKSNTSPSVMLFVIPSLKECSARSKTLAQTLIC